MVEVVWSVAIQGDQAQEQLSEEVWAECSDEKVTTGKAHSKMKQHNSISYPKDAFLASFAIP